MAGLVPGAGEVVAVLKEPRRTNFFTGRLLAAEDLRAEQEYLAGKLGRHARLLHGAGVVCGLAVAPPDGGALVVEPGLAIDGLGREIVVPEPVLLPCPPEPSWFTILLAYSEQPDGELATEGGPQPAWVRETFRFETRPGRAEPVGSPPAEEAVPCSEPEQQDECVVLASVDCSGDAPVVEQRGVATLCSSEALLGIVMGLVERVGALEASLSS